MAEAALTAGRYPAQPCSPIGTPRYGGSYYSPHQQQLLSFSLCLGIQNWGGEEGWSLCLWSSVPLTRTFTDMQDPHSLQTPTTSAR